MRKTRPLRKYRITVTNYRGTARTEAEGRSFGQAAREAAKWLGHHLKPRDDGGFDGVSGELVGGCNVVTVPQPTKIKAKKIPTSKYARRKGMAA